MLPDTVDPMVLTCPGDITFTVRSGEAPVPVTFSVPTATDNSGTAQLIFNTHSPGDLFPAGTTPVEYRFRDEAGNTASCQFVVNIVQDDPCSPQPCQNGAACIPTSISTYQCICPDCFTGDNCETAVDACDGNSCQNGAACVPLAGSCTQYECQCPDCFTGRFCQSAVNSCDNNQCANGAQCVPNTDNCVEYSCQCPPCFRGRYCDIPVSACDNNECQNGGVCMASSQTPNAFFACSQYTCACTGCYTGALCDEERVPCSPNPCLNGGNCVAVPDSCSSYTCQCEGCFTGYNCEIPVPSGCANDPCQNGAVCSEVAGACGAYICTCPNGFIGRNCETQSISNPNPCNSFPCENGASCLTMDNIHYVCLCTDDYTGQNCITPIGSAPQLDPCSNNPCGNGARCVNSYNSNSGLGFLQYTCICAAGFSGVNCNTPTSDVPALDICNQGVRPPCEQGAQCSNAYHSFDQDVDYYCDCPSGYIGHNCETSINDPCVSGPCRNGAACVSFNNYFMCECQAGFGGKSCETRIGDVTPPVISNCPMSIYIRAQGQASQAATWTQPEATDNSGSVSLIYSSHQPNTQFTVGVTPVTLIFADPSQNYARCTFMVTVDDPGTDNTPPSVVNCPGDQEVTAAQGATSAAVTWTEPEATDDSGVVNRFVSSESGSQFGIGVTPVVYTFTDSSGNVANCRFSVTVNSPAAPVDNIPPVVENCPMGASATAASGSTSASVTWTPPTATDNSGSSVSVVASNQPGDVFPTGITTVVYTFSDPSGNNEVCSFVVMVNAPTMKDTIPPVISNCPSDQVVAPDAGANMATVSWTEPTATDNSGQVPGLSKSHNPPASFPANSITRVSYIFYDISGNFDSCAFTVQVTMPGEGTDNVDPVFVNCPTNQVSYVNGPDATASIAWTVPVATDNSGLTPVITGSLTPPVNLGVGSVNALYTATDAAGNQATCSFSVDIILDQEAPTFNSCPSDQTLTLPTGVSSITADWIEPVASDNSGSASVTTTNSPGDAFTLGTNVVVYTATDPAGNQATCSFNIVIVQGLNTNPCSSSPCNANENCYYRVDPPEYLCLASTNKRDTEEDGCKCHNGGVCIDGFDGTTCFCSSNFTGVLCEQPTSFRSLPAPVKGNDLKMFNEPMTFSVPGWVLGGMVALLSLVVIVLALVVSRMASRILASTEKADKSALVY
jgi:hypothetical protein